MTTNGKIRSKKPSENASKIHWHPGFYGGVEFELKDYKDALVFENEHELSREPLRMDMLIIKKKTDIEIVNQLGIIFRKYNIIEYKSPDDGMSIDDYIKAIGYAFIYKGLGSSIDEIPLDELTVSLCRDTYPRKLIKSIKKYGGNIYEKFPGIYYVTGIAIIPSQIIVTSELVGKDHSILRILSNRAKEEDVRTFLEIYDQIKEPGVKNLANAVVAVSSVANNRLFNQVRRDSMKRMTLMEIMEDDIKEREDAVQVSDIRNIMETMNLSVDEAMDALRIPDDKRVNYKEAIL